MKITFSGNIPDSTYFRTGEAEPRLASDGTVICLDGRGRDRSWGHPGVTSTVVVEREHFVAVHVGFYHKHGGSQFWRYFRPEGQVPWRGLTEQERLEVLDGWVKRAPGWADCPGKLRRDYIRPGELSRAEELADGRLVGYKMLWVDGDGGLHSPVACGTPLWEDGRLMADRVPDQANTNGIYCTKSPKDPALARYVDSVLVRLALSGTVIEHERGFRAEHAEILEVLG
jgi:hypothetical protein